MLIACDGSSLKKPDGSIGGAIGSAWAREDGHWAYVGQPEGTNQRAELFAMCMVLAYHPGQALHVQADSQYTLNVTQKWAKGWARNKWIKADGKPILNLNIIQPLYEMTLERTKPVEYQWVKGHRKDNAFPLNTLADKYASEASAAARKHKFTAAEPFIYLDSKGRTTTPKIRELYLKCFGLS